MWILNSDQMRKCDRITIEDLKVPGIILMENAGISVVNVIEEVIEEINELRYLVVCGRGNNGGDGFVVARHLKRRGTSVEVILVGHAEQLKGDALANYQMLKVYTSDIHIITTEEELSQKRSLFIEADIIIDALFGTGLSTAIEGIYSAVVEEINKHDAIVISIDTPSGLSSDTNKIIGPCVNADITVTLATMKWCHIFPPAEYMCGEVFVKDIGIPKYVLEQASSNLKLITNDDITKILLPRIPDTHKSNYGEILVVAGSVGKLGAAWMTGQSAMRSGAGLVSVGIPDSCHTAMMSKVIELMTIGFPSTEDGTFSFKALEPILDFAKDKDLISVGPGITTHPDCIKLVHELIKKYEKIIVIDADGINAIAKNVNVLKEKKGKLILTPHPGEMARLINSTSKEVQENRVQVAYDFAIRYEVILVLKGYRTLIAFPDGMVYVNPTGNAGMASGGVGDVLTGMIAGFVGQNVKNINQAVLTAVYLHGLAGDIAKEKLGEIPLVASEIMRSIPKAIKLTIGEQNT